MTTPTDPWALLAEVKRHMHNPRELSGLGFSDLRYRIDAALAAREAEGDKLVFTRVGPCLKDQHGDEWWNANFLRLAQSNKDSLRRVTEIIQHGARAEDERDKARRENERLRDALMLAEIDLEGDKTQCRICRTQSYRENAQRESHPHAQKCILFNERGMR